MIAITIEEIQSYKTKTALEKECIDILLNNIKEEYIESYFEDLMQYGCVNGMVSGLIYYSETLAFYDRHKDEINEILQDLLWSCGFSCPSELFSDKWDKEDPLALETTNQNLLAWFAF